MKKIEAILEWGGIKRDIIFLLISGLALLADFFEYAPLPFNVVWVARSFYVVGLLF